MQEDLAETMQRYREKASQWENAQEALDQLTDELEAHQNLLRESQQKAHRLKSQAGSLREQVGALKQQRGPKSQEHRKGMAQPGLQFSYFLTLFFNITAKHLVRSRCVRAYLVRVFLCNLNA